MATNTIQKIRNRLERKLNLPDLTPRQSQVLNYVLQCWMSGFIPTYRMICDEFGFASTQAVAGNVKALQREGYLLEDDVKSSLILSDKALELVLRAPGG